MCVPVIFMRWTTFSHYYWRLFPIFVEFGFAGLKKNSFIKKNTWGYWFSYSIDLFAKVWYAILHIILKINELRKYKIKCKMFMCYYLVSLGFSNLV